MKRNLILYVGLIKSMVVLSADGAFSPGRVAVPRPRRRTSYSVVEAAAAVTEAVDARGIASLHKRRVRKETDETRLAKPILLESGGFSASKGAVYKELFVPDSIYEAVRRELDLGGFDIISAKIESREGMRKGFILGSSKEKERCKLALKMMIIVINMYLFDDGIEKIESGVLPRTRDTEYDPAGHVSEWYQKNYRGIIPIRRDLIPLIREYAGFSNTQVIDQLASSFKGHLDEIALIEAKGL